jgi:hypothetical protein
MFQTPSLPPRVKAHLNSIGASLFAFAYKGPATLAYRVADKIETVATHKKVMYGPLACITFPPSIMLRNGARAIKMVTRDTHLASILGGLIGSGVAAAQVGSAIFAGGGILTGVIAMAAASAAIVPGFILGVFGMAALFGATAMTLSTLPAMVNVPVAMLRTRDALTGKLPPLDLPPRPEPKPAPAPVPKPPEINVEEATTLNDHLTFKKVKISFKKSAEQPSEAPAPGVKEFNPGDAIGSRKTITL